MLSSVMPGTRTVFLLFALLIPLMACGKSRASEEALKLECAKNLRELFLALNLFVPENKDEYPRADDVKGNLIFEGTLIYPEYLTSMKVLGCPSDFGVRNGTTFRLRNNLLHPGYNIGDLHPDCITCESYIYLGWVIANEEEGLAAIQAYLAASPDEFAEDLLVPNGKGNNGGNVIKRLSARAFTPEVPVAWEWPTNHGDGGNVLYFDGHIEFVPYPGKFPMTEKFVEALRKIETNFPDDIPPIITR